MSGAKEKRIDVPFTSGDSRAGESVTIVGRASLGLWATVVAFVLPLMLLLLGLFVATSVGVGERQAALLSLAALGAYYFGLYLFRNKFRHTFTFTIQND
jgi:sigma-E factor negative regulatory protein RseC